MKRALLIATSFHLLLFLLFRIESECYQEALPLLLPSTVFLDSDESHVTTLSLQPSFERSSVTKEEVLQLISHSNQESELKLLVGSECEIISYPLEILTVSGLKRALFPLQEPVNVDLVVDNEGRPRVIHSSAPLSDDVRREVLSLRFNTEAFAAVHLEVYPVHH